MRAILLFITFFSLTPVYADVSCTRPTIHRCMDITGTGDCKKMICDGGKLEGFIDRNERLKAIKVQVIDPKTNLPKLKETLLNPPQNLSHYLENSINHDNWIATQLINKGHDLGRLDIVQLQPEDSLIFSDNTSLYADKDKKTTLGVLGELKSKKQYSQRGKFNIICQYSATPELIQSSRCKNEISCIAPVRCFLYENDGSYKMQSIRTTAMCKANGLKCPPPQDCMLDSSTHFLNPLKPENAEEIMEYKVGGYGGASHGVKPAQIEDIDDVGSVR